MGEAGRGSGSFALKSPHTEISAHLQGSLDNLLTKPGCDSMKNAAGRIIYLGKATNLENRARSYFHADTGHDNKTHLIDNPRNGCIIG